jgi:hypothetical protein
VKNLNTSPLLSSVKESAKKELNRRVDRALLEENLKKLVDMGFEEGKAK